MKVQTFYVAGVVYATCKIAGVAGGYWASGKTVAEAIDNVLFRAMNSKVV